MQKSFYRHTPKIVGTVVLSAVLVIGIYTLILTSEPDETSTIDRETTTQSSLEQSTSINESTSLPASTPTQDSDADQEASALLDGTYNATVRYSVPKGHTNNLSVEVTLKSGTIESITTTSDYEDHESDEYVSRFERSVSAAVTDEKIESVSIGRIGGASLTSDAFERALNAIITKARS